MRDVPDELMGNYQSLPRVIFTRAAFDEYVQSQGSNFSDQIRRHYGWSLQRSTAIDPINDLKAIPLLEVPAATSFEKRAALLTEHLNAAGTYIVAVKQEINDGKGTVRIGFSGGIVQDGATHFYNPLIRATQKIDSEGNVSPSDIRAHFKTAELTSRSTVPARFLVVVEGPAKVTARTSDFGLN